MAHVGIVSAAYWGDVMPLVPVAEELAARGHRVTLAVPEGFHDVLRPHGLDLVHLGTDFSPRELEAHGDVMERADTVRGMRAAIDLWVRELSIEPAERIVTVLEDVAPDVWLAHATTTWLVELQAVPTGTPVVAAHLFPMMLPSEHQRPPMLGLPDVAWARRLGWRVGRAMIARMMYDDRVNALRRARGLPPARANVGFGWERADRVLVLTSPRYWPVPPDWPEHVEVTGFTVWHAATPAPADLGRWLDDGEPPVLVTLGTSAASNARDAFELAAGAVEAAGGRPLLLVGSERNAAALAGRDDVWSFAPLPEVLARCRAVVHAAGHGTTAAALEAGVPQVVLPQGFDQVVHARRLEQLGVGRTVPWRRRSVRRIRAALDRALTPDVEEAAARLAAGLRTEDGPRRAADAVERTLAAR